MIHHDASKRHQKESARKNRMVLPTTMLSSEGASLGLVQQRRRYQGEENRCEEQYRIRQNINKEINESKNKNRTAKMTEMKRLGFVVIQTKRILGIPPRIED